MQIRPEALAGQLERGLLPIYLISGEEPLQSGEAGDAIRRQTRAAGYSERQVFSVESGFDWGSLTAASDTLSLFAELRLVELRLSGNSFGKEGGAALTAWAEQLPQDTLLLIHCGKLDKRQQTSKWYKAIDRVGGIVTIWPVEAAALPGWLQQRMRTRGMTATAPAAQLLAERVEGNLLAAAQEVEKLRLLYGESTIDEAQIEESVADSARYDIFALTDAALAGEAARVSRIADGLRAEGVEPVLLLWALSREIRALYRMAEATEQGQRPEQVMREQRVWAKRQGAVAAALRRHDTRRWGLMLRRAARLDRMVKGMEPGVSGKPWDELLQLALIVAGVRVV